MAKNKTDKILVGDPEGSADNLVLPFQIEGMDVRGRAVRLGTEVDGILSAHKYPDPVSRLLGEALALIALLGSFMKNDGVMTLQTKSDGPVSMLVADYMTPGIIRGYARFDAKRLAEMEAPSDGELLGRGHMAITLDQGKNMERYQGVVALGGGDLVAAAEAYFLASEQTPTAVKLAAGRDPLSDHWRAGGLMVQHLARGEEGRERLTHDEAAQDEAWRRVTTLLDTLKPEELMDRALPLPDLLFRLYHEDGVRVFAPIPLKRGCRCSEEKIKDAIASFSKDDIDHMKDAEGLITADCEFCGAVYNIRPEDDVGS